MSWFTDQFAMAWINLFQRYDTIAVWGKSALSMGETACPDTEQSPEKDGPCAIGKKIRRTVVIAR
jgi:hypothetical protein